MKLNLSLSSIIILTASLFFACNNSSDSTSETQESEKVSKKNTKVTCLFTQVPVWKTPSTKEYLNNVFLGEEMLYQGETVADTNKNGKISTYLKVQLSDGQIAWINEYHAELDGKPGVCTKEINTYKRPTDIAITEDKLEAVSFVVIKENKDDEWLKLIVPNLKKWTKSTIWIKNENISENIKEIGAASIYHKTMNKKGDETDVERLESILELIEAYNDTKVYRLIQEELDADKAELEEESEDLPEEMEMEEEEK